MVATHFADSIISLPPHQFARDGLGRATPPGQRRVASLFDLRAFSNHDVLYAAAMLKYKVGDHLLVKLSGGRIVEATIQAIIETTDGVRLQMSFGEETALI